jgi:hypothetical protein
MISCMIILLGLNSCSIEKRTYNRGYHLDFLHSGNSHTSPNTGNKKGKASLATPSGNSTPTYETTAGTSLAKTIAHQPHQDLETASLENEVALVTAVASTQQMNSPSDMIREEQENMAHSLSLKKSLGLSDIIGAEDPEESKETSKKIEGFSLLSWLIGIPGIFLGDRLNSGALIFFSILTIFGLTIYGLYRIAMNPKKWKGKFLSYFIGVFVVFFSLILILLGMTWGFD